MSKTLTMKSLSTGRGVIAGALCVALTAFGCTTDRTLGNGQPARSTPYVRTAPTAGVSTGSQTMAIPQSMTSSSVSHTQNHVSRSTGRRGALTGLTADEAAAIMAGHQGAQRGFRVLGPAHPGYDNRPYLSDTRPMTSATAGAMRSTTTPLTVNETFFSDQVAGIADTGATGGFTGALITGGVTDVTGASGAATVVSGALPPLTSMTSSSVASTTNAAFAGPSGIANSPSSSIRGTVTGGARSGVRTSGTTAGSGATTSAGVENPVRLVPRSNGRVMITNVTASGRSN